MSTQACLPSMKPLGMALGVRISYLENAHKQLLDNTGNVRVHLFVCANISMHTSKNLYLHVCVCSCGCTIVRVHVHASPLSELLEDNAVGEALSADPDSLQDSVTPELVQDQVRVQLTCLQRVTHLGSLPVLV